MKIPSISFSFLWRVGIVDIVTTPVGQGVERASLTHCCPTNESDTLLEKLVAEGKVENYSVL